jgi:hypothetical protein
MWSAFGGSSSFGVDNNVGSTEGENLPSNTPPSPVAKTTEPDTIPTQPITTEVDTLSTEHTPSNIDPLSVAKVTETEGSSTSQTVQEKGTESTLESLELNKSAPQDKQITETDVKSNHVLDVGREREGSTISLNDDEMKDSDSITTNIDANSVRKEPEIQAEISKPEALIIDNFVSSFEYSPKSPFGPKTSFFPDVSTSSTSTNHLIKSVTARLGGGACGIVAKHLQNEVSFISITLFFRQPC